MMLPTPGLKSLLLTTTILLHHTLPVHGSTTPVRDGNPSCKCYLVSGPSQGYFQNYRFIDFRPLTAGSGEDFTQPPALVNASQNQGSEAVTSSYFNTDAWNSDWFIHSGSTSHDSGRVSSIDSARNVFLFEDGDENVSYLALRAQRLDAFVSNAEVDSQIADILYSSIRTRARFVPSLPAATEARPLPFVNLNSSSIDGLTATHPVAPGAVLGFFTFAADTQESDIEILSSDPVTDIRYSNQPDYNSTTDQSVPGASTQQTISPSFDWTAWHDHRIDWYAGVSRWYVDDVLVLEKTVNVPTAPAQLVLNVWSDGGSWSGNMSVGAQIVGAFQWVEMVYNVSSGNGASRLCGTGCAVDGVKVKGVPQTVFSSGTVVSKTRTMWLLGLVLFAGLWFG